MSPVCSSPVDFPLPLFSSSRPLPSRTPSKAALFAAAVFALTIQISLSLPPIGKTWVPIVLIAGGTLGWGTYFMSRYP